MALRLPNTPIERPAKPQQHAKNPLQRFSKKTVQQFQPGSEPTYHISSSEQPSTASAEPTEDQRQLGHWREQLYRMFQFVGTVTGTPGLIGAGAVGTLTVSVVGCFADQNQTVEIGAPSAIDAGLIWSGFVSANDVVTIRMYNGTGGGITPASLTWAARVTP